MDPVHIFFKELEINQDNTFTANISQENEVENVVFNTDKEYAVTGICNKTRYYRFWARKNWKH